VNAMHIQGVNMSKDDIDRIVEIASDYAKRMGKEFRQDPEKIKYVQDAQIQGNTKKGGN
jgi:hypothetical protein